MMRFRKGILTGRARVIRLLALTIAIINITVLAASASASASASGGAEELRRIDTSNVNKATDIRAVGEEAGHDDEAETEAHGAEAESTDEEAHGEAEEEGHHAPAWMIPGWQSIFTILAVVYFGLGVTLLPRIMAKEEH